MYSLHEINFKWFESVELLRTNAIPIVNARTH